jgi:hypothetical protein
MALPDPKQPFTVLRPAGTMALFRLTTTTCGPALATKADWSSPEGGLCSEASLA